MIVIQLVNFTSLFLLYIISIILIDMGYSLWLYLTILITLIPIIFVFMLIRNAFVHGSRFTGFPFKLLLANSSVMGVVFGLFSIYAAWLHNPMNSVHDGFREINYGYLFLIFVSWTVPVFAITAAAQATGLFVYWMLRKIFRSPPVQLMKSNAEGTKPRRSGALGR